MILMFIFGRWKYKIEQSLEHFSYVIRLHRIRFFARIKNVIASHFNSQKIMRWGLDNMKRVNEICESLYYSVLRKQFV